jgi:hypothetical protein
MHNVITFQEALDKSKDCNRRHLLTGNGFSIACRQNIFRYDSLFNQADFSKMNPAVKKIFEVLNTRDFEIVMKSLASAKNVLKIYAPDRDDIVGQLEHDIVDLKNILINTIANSHPSNPSDILESEYLSCRDFLQHFNNCYTLNYDLLLYWVFMHFQESKQLYSDDGFRTPDSGKREYVCWDIEKTDGQNLFYLHGALHVFDAGSELQKYTWVNTGISLIEQIRTALDSNLFPVFVSEGSSADKQDKIMHSNYLSRGLRSFSHIGGCLFIFGHSLAINDEHIINLIPKTKITQLFVSLHGDINNSWNQEIVRKAEALVEKRGTRKPLELYFYNSDSAQIWNK